MPSPSRVASGPSIPERRVHAIVLRSHGPRLAAHTMASFVCASTMLERPWWYAAATLALGLGWPLAATAIGRRAADSRVAGQRNLLGDGFVGGLWAGLAGLSALPAGIALPTVGGFLVMMGGVPLFVSGLPLMALGVALGLTVSGFHPFEQVSGLTTALCVAQTGLTFFATAHAVHNATKDLIFVRRDLRQAVAEITSIAEVAQTLNSTLDERRVLDKINEALSTRFPFNQVGFLRYDRARGRLEPRALTGEGFPPTLQTRLLQMDFSLDGVFGRAVSTGLPEYHPRITEDRVAGMAPSDRALFELNPVHSLLTLPLSMGDEVIGVIVFSSTREDVVVSPSDITTIGRYVTHLATALRNAQLFEDAEAARATAHEANEAKSRFLANMSHELRTPLNGILGYAQLLHRDRGLTAEQSHRVHGIERSGTHLLALINDVLDLSKIEAGGIEVEMESLRVRSLVADVADMVRARAESTHTTVTVDVSPDVPEGVRTDAAKLRQVLINLMGNAVKFTQHGHIRLQVSRPTTDTLQVDVSDSGAGIPPEQLDEIFEPFKQADAGKRRGGTGLGLAISRRLVNAMGGTLTVESEVGRGSTFSVVLPLVAADADDLVAIDDLVRAEAVDYHLAPGQDITVLVVDDNETNRDILTGLLKQAGFGVEEAANGQEAVARQRAGCYPLILMDLVMPVMDGMTATQLLRDDPAGKDTVIIAVSASVLTSDRDRAIEAGFNDFLSKPLKASHLFRTIARLLVVRFGTDVQPVPSPPASPPEDESPLPPALAAETGRQLRLAIDLGDVDSVTAIGERLRAAGHPAVGARVIDLARGFDFDGLLDVATQLTLAGADENGATGRA